MQDKKCQHEMWFAGVLDGLTDVSQCKCLDCGFEKVISIQSIGRENIVSVNKHYNEFNPVTFERAQKAYKELKKVNPVSAKIRIRKKYDI